MGQLVEELILKSDNYTKNINSAINRLDELKRKSNTTSGGIGSLSKSLGGLGGALTKVAGVFGVAMGAADVFNRMMTQSQTVGDAVVKVQSQASEAVNYFATCLARADFSNFLSGLQNIISKAGEVADKLDELQSRNLLFSGKMNKLQNQYNKYADIARDPTQSKKAREEALEGMKKLNAEMSKYEKSMANVNTDYAYSNIRKELSKHTDGKLKVGDKAIDWMFDYANYDKRSQLAENWKKQRDDAKKKIAEAKAARDKRQKKENQNYVGGAGRRIDYTPEEKANIASAEATLKKLAKDTTGRLAYAATQIDDAANSELAQSIEALNRSNDLLRAGADRTYQEGRIEKKLDGSTTSGGGAGKSKTVASTKPQYAEGSMGWYDEQIAAIKKQILFETNPNNIAKLQKEIDDLTNRKLVLDAQVNMRKLADEAADWCKQHPITLSPVFDEKKLENLPKIQLPAPEFKEKRNFFEDSSKIIGGLEGIDNTVNSIRTLSNAIYEGANAWEVFISVVRTVGSVIQTVGSVMEAVNTIMEISAATASATAAEQTAASAQVVAAKSGEAIAGATASGAKMPFPANLVAIAAGIAAVVSAISMISGFANGGIVQGSGGFVGDRNLIRVNSGEAVLTKGQQANLWRMLDGGAGSVGKGGNVTFTIAGSTLKGVLRNHDNKMNKVK